MADIRIGALEGYRDLVHELGGDPSAMLADAGVKESLWQAPDTRISTETYRAVLNLAAKATGTPRFGLLLSQRQSFDKLGAVGYLVKHAPDLRSAITELQAFFRTHDNGTVSGLEEDDGVALWTHTLSGLGSESSIQQTDLAMGLALKFVRSAIDPTWSPDALYFEHGRPHSTRLYDRVFRCPVYFDHDQSAMEFPASDLARALISADPKLHKILHSYINQVDGSQEHDLISDVRKQISAAISRGKPYIDDVSRSLSMSRSELQRRLKQEDKSFQVLLEDVRYGIARKYLSDTNLSISEITAMLAYAEPAVFIRAFKRISGKTPLEWRKMEQVQTDTKA